MRGEFPINGIARREVPYDSRTTRSAFYLHLGQGSSASIRDGISLVCGKRSDVAPLVATVTAVAIAHRRHISALSCSLNRCCVHLVQRLARCVGQRESDDVDSPAVVNASACCV